MPDRNSFGTTQIRRTLITKPDIEPTCSRIFGPLWQSAVRPAIQHELHRLIDGYREVTWLHYILTSDAWNSPGFYIAPSFDSPVYVSLPGDWVLPRSSGHFREAR